MRQVIPLYDRRAPLAPHVSVQGTLADRRGRALRDLRISVTDRCNFRCTYCMPKEVFGRDYAFLPHADVLSFEEIARLAAVFKERGVEKIRLTGGEPLLRRGIERLIEMLAKLGLDLTLTTNGALLAKKAQSLKDAGLRRITVSLDSLDDQIFRTMNDVDFPVDKVLEGIETAAQSGFHPIKINAVIKRDVNDQGAIDLARYFKTCRHILRFIEYMDVGHTNGWRMNDVVSSAELIQRIHAVWPIEALEPNYPGEVAERWRYLDGAGEIGFISSVTRAFCGDCTRARLSTDGKLYTCLFATQGHDLRALLRDGRENELAQTIAAIWSERNDRYSEIRSEKTKHLEKIEMSYIGG